MKVAIIGYGVVGSGVYEILKQNHSGIEKRAGQSIDVKYVLDIRDFPDHPEKDIFVKDFNIILDDPEVELVVETMGGVRFAYDYTKNALLKGKSVVTSNKELVAQHGHEFFEIAREKNCRYLFEASVGGGIPVIRPLARCLAANEIEDITGIINGTTNYILTKMFMAGESYEAALSQAQALGYAEKDPTADVDGIDVCRKIAILASMTLGKKVDCELIPTSGIRNITDEDVACAERMQCSIKLVGSARFKDGKAGVFVSPMMIPWDNPLSRIDDVYNGILAEGNMVGQVMFYGKGAGKLPTASAVVGDIVDVARSRDYSGEFSWVKTDEAVTFDPAEIETPFFVRVKEGSLAETKERLGAVREYGGVCLETPAMSENEINRRLSDMDAVVSVMRIYR